MYNIIATEFLKIKRYYVIKAGIIMMLLSVFMSYFYSTANTDKIWDFQYFIQQVIISNCTLFFPLVITLVAVYIISREGTDDTLKAILSVPISYKKLITGKLYLLLCLTVFFSLFNGIIAIIANLFLKFPGMGISQIVLAIGQIVLANILTYVAVLPIIVICAMFANKSLGFVAVSFIYGYFGTFEGSLLNWYPIKASMIIADPNCGKEFGISYDLEPAIASIFVVFMLSILMLKIWNENKNIKIKVKAKKMMKEERKKGW